MDNNFVTREISILYQLISLGLHESAYSLSLILGKVIKIKTPTFESLNSANVKDLLCQEHISNNIVTLDFDEKYEPSNKDVISKFPGQILFSISKEQSKALAHMYASSQDINEEIVNSANLEIGNTLSAAILNTIADKLCISLSPALPNLYNDIEEETIEKIINYEDFLKAQNGKSIIIRSSFIDKNTEIEINIFILFYKNTFKELIERLKRNHYS